MQGLINSFGSSVIAGYSAAIKLNTFTITSFTTLGNGISSFTAQNIGAGKVDRKKQGMRGGVGWDFSWQFHLPGFRCMMSLFMQEKRSSYGDRSSVFADRISVLSGDRSEAGL